MFLPLIFIKQNSTSSLINALDNLPSRHIALKDHIHFYYYIGKFFWGKSLTKKDLTFEKIWITKLLNVNNFFD